MAMNFIQNKRREKKICEREKPWKTLLKYGLPTSHACAVCLKQREPVCPEIPAIVTETKALRRVSGDMG